jgi:hypothetical protein
MSMKAFLCSSFLLYMYTLAPHTQTQAHSHTHLGSAFPLLLLCALLAIVCLTCLVCMMCTSVRRGAFSCVCVCMCVYVLINVDMGVRHSGYSLGKGSRKSLLGFGGVCLCACLHKMTMESYKHLLKQKSLEKYIHPPTRASLYVCV